MPQTEKYRHKIVEVQVDSWKHESIEQKSIILNKLVPKNIRNITYKWGSKITQ